jgi:hypothetical protein
MKLLAFALATITTMVGTIVGAQPVDPLIAACEARYNKQACICLATLTGVNFPSERIVKHCSLYDSRIINDYKLIQ